jgi:DHA3 family macrolide efflux protein-like MFS transporter
MLVLRPLAQRSIALLWTGQVLAATGSEFYMVAVVWISAGLIGRDAGYVSALQSAALLVASLFGGVVTDRWWPRSTMIASDVARAGVLLVLSVAGLFGLMSLPLLLLIAGLTAFGTASFDPALQATLPGLAPDPVMRHATNALFDATRRVARILGPSLIAVVNSVLPTGQFFTVTAVTFLLSALAVRVAISKPAAAHPRRLAGRAALLDSLIGGVRTARRRPVLLYGLFISLIGNAVWAVGVLLGMILYLRQTSADPLTDYSLMMTGYGIGNLGSSLVLANTRKIYPASWLAISKLIFGFGVFLLPLEHGRVWLMAAAAFAATNGPFENLSLLNLIQTGVPARRVGQLYRLQMCATYLGFLLAYLAAPSLFGWFGLRPVIMAAGLFTVVCGLLGFVLFGWPGRPRKSGVPVQTT